RVIRECIFCSAKQSNFRRSVANHTDERRDEPPPWRFGVAIAVVAPTPESARVMIWQSLH
ncbi:TPA: hypothetical protein ACVAA2_006036, partial [Burkholderia contaminans]